MILAEGSVCNWATADDDKYIKQVKRELYAQLRRQRVDLIKGLSPYGVGSFPTREYLEEWNRVNPNFAINENSFDDILKRADENLLASL